jgi:hypothetical protein
MFIWHHGQHSSQRNRDRVPGMAPLARSLDSLLADFGRRSCQEDSRAGHASIKLTMDTYGHLFDGSDGESPSAWTHLFPKRPPVRRPSKSIAFIALDTLS